jgi:hypothetical protein
MVCQAQLWLQRGKTAAAHRLLATAADEFTAMAMPWYRAAALNRATR